jgi:hypothetical protein
MARRRVSSLGLVRSCSAASLTGWEHGGTGQVLPVPEAAYEGRQSVLRGQFLEGQPEANAVDFGHVGRHPFQLSL